MGYTMPLSERETKCFLASEVVEIENDMTAYREKIRTAIEAETDPDIRSIYNTIFNKLDERTDSVLFGINKLKCK